MGEEGGTHLIEDEIEPVDERIASALQLDERRRVVRYELPPKPFSQLRRGC